MIGIIGTFVGGLGLFLLAVSMITDGLRLAAGDALRDVLSRSTRTPLRGVMSGVVVTGIVQSSSAVTVATIGFVNAGLLTLAQSLGIIYGANVGTTMTGWIVAAVGFSFNAETFALPLLGIGMLSRVLRPNARVAMIGQALAGFGLFFIGVDVLQDAFETFSASVDVAGIAPLGGMSTALYVLFGFAMTLVTQSSSAAIAITLTAATGGAIDLTSAAAMVIGTNVGTTSTAALAVIGATPNAKRVAAAHVVFNLVTGVVAVVLLPAMLWTVSEVGSTLQLQDAPAVSLALFHTVFNVLGVILMWPLTKRLASHLEGRFTTESERLGRPEYLDHNALANPVLAVDALQLELQRVMALCRDAVAATLSSEDEPSRYRMQQLLAIRALIDQIENFVDRLELERLPQGQQGHLSLALRVSGYLEDVVGLCQDAAEHRADVSAVSSSSLVADAVQHFQVTLLSLVRQCDPSRDGFSAAELTAGYDRLRDVWHGLKDVLVGAAADRRLPIRRLNAATEGLRSYLKMAEQLTKAAVRLSSLADTPDDVAET